MVMSRTENTTEAIDRGRGEWMQGLYRDGCDLATSCFDCPLTNGCRYEQPPGKARSEIRREQVITLLREGNSPDDVADAMGISRRSVYRLKEGTTMQQTEDPARSMQCAKCRGRLRYEAGIDGHVLKCHQCGNEVPTQAPAARPQPANGTVPRLTHVASVDWIAGAKQELERHIAAVAEADKHRAEAERIHRALSVYGVSIPMLPWKAGKKAAPAASKTGERADRYDRCIRCGAERYIAGRTFLVTPGGRVCRNEAECEERVAAKVPA